MTSTTARTQTGRTGLGERRAWRRSLGRAAALAALALAASGGILAGPAPTPANAQVPPATGASCAPGQGVTVVVDFNGLPGGIRVGCAPGIQASGLSALGAAGFGVSMGDAPGVVCTIDGAPVEGYPFCWLTGGYWSYWRAPRGGSWAFSPVGAGAGPLPVDSVEGWSWAPGFTSSPPRANEASTPPATTIAPSTTSVTEPTSTSTSAPQSTTSTPRPISTALPMTTAPAPDPSPTAGPGAVAGAGTTGRTTGPGGASGATLARTGSDTRSPLTIAALLLLAGVVLVAASRRLATDHR